MKYRFIKQYSSFHRVQKMCHVLRVSRSGYYQWLKGKISQRTQANENLLEEIKKIHSDPYMENYGSPRMATELKDRGFSCSEPRVARIMKKNNIKSKIKLKYKVTTNSDPGVQYASDGFRVNLSDYGMIQSMSGKGNCYDNAVAESFFKTLKTELIYKTKYKTRKDARQAIFQYIEYFYNRYRKHSYLGNLSPEQFELNYLKKLKNNAA